MVKIIYRQSNGAEHEVDVEPGTSVMQAAVDHGISNILGECGGQMACGTCLVYVDQAWRAATGEASPMEDDTLVLHENDPSEGKRLSCQIKVSDALEGLVVHLPDNQY